ncbi:ABC transporter permease [Candidatus Saccharibacteria bacterium]|nr:ABC transporter permease [Candidatus Saccharibacteria bacterium]
MLQFWRILHGGIRNFLRNAWLSTAATAVMTVTLIIVIVSFISSLALTATIKGVTDKIDVSIFLNNNTTPDQVAAFEAALKSSGNVASLMYVSPDQAVANYKNQNKDKPSLIQALDTAGNVLPSSIEVKAIDPKHLDAIEAVVSQQANQSLLDPTAPPSYTGGRKETIDRIVHFANFFKTAGLAASIVFVVISTLIIFNTIRMAIFTRRDEIEIMKLVGATKWFIRGPFIFEAALYGIIAAIVAVTFSYLVLLSSAPKVASYIDFGSTISFFQSYPFVILGGELLLGIIIGAVSSILAMSRYLKL